MFLLKKMQKDKAAAAARAQVTLEFESKPNGANVHRLSDGKKVGVTPFTLKMARSIDADETFEFRLKDHKPVRRKVIPNQNRRVTGLFSAKEDDPGEEKILPKDAPPAPKDVKGTQVVKKPTKKPPKKPRPKTRPRPKPEKKVDPPTKTPDPAKKPPNKTDILDPFASDE
jgi:hypothetical protein